MPDPSIRKPIRLPAPPELPILIGALVVALALYAILAGDSKFLIVAMLPLLGVGVYAVLHHPLLGLAMLAVLVSGNVSENLTLSFGTPSLNKIVVPALAALFVLRYITQRARPFVAPATLALFALYLGLIATSMLYARYWGVSRSITQDYLKDFAFVLLTVAFFDRARALRWYVSALLGTICLICLLGFYKYALGDMAKNYAGFATVVFVEERYAGPMRDPNYFAALLAFLLPQAMGWALLRTDIRSRILGGLAAVILVAALLLTGSRGAMVASLAAALLFLFLLSGRTLATVLVLMAAGAAVVLLFASSSLIDRFDLIFEPSTTAFSNDVSVEGRLASWTVAVNLFYGHPFFGVGAGNFNPYFQDSALELGLNFRGEDRSAHSLYLEVLSELGIVGLSFLLLMFTTALAGAWRASKRLLAAGALPEARDVQAFGVGLFAYLVSMVFLHDAYPLMLWTLVAIGISLPAIAAAELRRSGR